MLPAAFLPERITKQHLQIPVVHSFLSKRSVCRSLLNTKALQKLLTKHLQLSRARLSWRTSALPLSDVQRNGRIIRSVNGLKQRYYERKLADELAQTLCGALQLEGKAQLQDFLASVVLSECVYKKVETSWENVVNIISQFTLDFPPGFVQIDSVQFSRADVPHNYIIASSKTAVYVAFMGTKQPRDLGTDVNFIPETIWDEAAGLLTSQPAPAAHRGFHERAKAVDIRFIYDLAASQGKRLVLCGHSLGAAVAKLCTVRLLKQLPDWARPNVHCYGFAAPAVGNAALAKLVERRGWSKHITTYLMPEDSVMRLVSLAQQNGAPFNLVQRPSQRQQQGKQEDAAAQQDAAELACTTGPSMTLSEQQAASELARMLQDEGDSSEESLQAASAVGAVDMRSAAGSVVQLGGEQGAGARGPRSAAAADGEQASSAAAVGAAEVEEVQRASLLGALAMQRKLGLKQLRKIAKRAQGTWASAASRVMSRYMPFGRHFFLMPNLQVLSTQSLEREPQTQQLAGTADNRPAGPFAFHRMMSYRGRVIQVLQKVGGARLERYMARPRPPPVINVTDQIFPQTNISSAAAWLPLLAAPSHPPHKNSAASSSTASLSSLSSTDDDVTPLPTPPTLTAEQTNALKASAAARGPHGLGTAVPLPGRRRQPKTVAMMIKVDGTGLRQCRSFSVRVEGHSGSFPAEVTHVGEDPLQQLQQQPADVGAGFAAKAGGAESASPRPAWMAALAPLGIMVGAAGKLLQAVLGGVMEVNQRLWGQRPLRPLQRKRRTAHAVLRVQLPAAVVRKLHSNRSSSTDAGSSMDTSGTSLVLLARSDFHELEVPVELRPNKVALIGTSQFAPLFVHAALSGQLGLPVGPAFGVGLLPSWIPRLSWLAALNPMARGRRNAGNGIEDNKSSKADAKSSNTSPPAAIQPGRDIQIVLPVPRTPAPTVHSSPAFAAATSTAGTSGSWQTGLNIPLTVFNPTAAVAASITALSLAAVTSASAEMGLLPEQVSPSSSIAASSRWSAFTNQFGSRRRTTSSKTALTATTAAMAIPRTRKESKESDNEQRAKDVDAVATGGKSPGPGEQTKALGGVMFAPDVVFSPEPALQASSSKASSSSSSSAALRLNVSQEARVERTGAVPVEKQRWSWLLRTRLPKKTQLAASSLAVGSHPQQSAAPAESSDVSSAPQVLPSKMHAGILYELSGSSSGSSPQSDPSAALQQLAKSLQRQVAQMSWFTGLWMALRGNGAVASWQTTTQMMGVFGSMLLALPTGPLQFFNLVAEAASDEHLHALVVVHTVGGDAGLLQSPEFAGLLGLARSADVAIIPVVFASEDAHPGEMLVAQYTVCQACGLPLGTERVVRVESSLAAAGSVSAVQSLPTAQQKQLGEGVQDLWHHVNNELLAKQLQLVNIIPRQSLLSDVRAGFK